jgi:hypothetical protein
MNRDHVVRIAAIVFGLLVLYALRDALLIVLLVLIAGIIGLLPYGVAIGLLILVGYVIYRYRRTTDSPDTSLASQLQSHFVRNNGHRLEQTLSRLPEWLITTRIKATAHELLTLKRSIYRAQAEGVPASLIQRYLSNTTQAADTLWQLASKIDAIGQNQIAYSVVEAQLQREDQRLHQLQRSIRETHEGIALVLAAGIQSDTLQTVEHDLLALSQAIKFLQAKA